MRRVRNLLIVVTVAATLTLVAASPPLGGPAQAQPPLFQLNPPIVVSATFSLKDAIERANSTPGQDVIFFDLNAPVQRGPFPPFTDSVTVTGAGDSKIEGGLRFEAPPPEFSDRTFSFKVDNVEISAPDGPGIRVDGNGAKINAQISEVTIRNTPAGSSGVSVDNATGSFELVKLDIHGEGEGVRLTEISGSVELRDSRIQVGFTAIRIKSKQGLDTVVDDNTLIGPQAGIVVSSQQGPDGERFDSSVTVSNNTIFSGDKSGVNPLVGIQVDLGGVGSGGVNIDRNDVLGYDLGVRVSNSGGLLPVDVDVELSFNELGDNGVAQQVAGARADPQRSSLGQRLGALSQPGGGSPPWSSSCERSSPHWSSSASAGRQNTTTR